MDEAKRLGDYLVEHYGGKVDIFYGISYGCRVLMEVLADPRLTITTTIADGMGLRDYPNIRSKWGKDVYCFFFTGIFYAVMGHPGPRRKKFLAKISGRTLEEADRILYGKATWKSWKNQDYFLIGRKTDYSLFTKTDMYLWYGIKGTVDKKLSANLDQLKRGGYPFEKKIFSDLGHGGLAGEHPQQFSQEVQAAHRRSLEESKEEFKMILQVILEGMGFGRYPHAGMRLRHPQTARWGWCIFIMTMYSARCIQLGLTTREEIQRNAIRMKICCHSDLSRLCAGLCLRRQRRAGIRGRLLAAAGHPVPDKPDRPAVDRRLLGRPHQGLDDPRHGGPEALHHAARRESASGFSARWAYR